MEVLTRQLLALQSPFVTCDGIGQTRRHDANDPVTVQQSRPSQRTKTRRPEDSTRTPERACLWEPVTSAG